MTYKMHIEMDPSSPETYVIAIQPPLPKDALGEITARLDQENPTRINKDGNEFKNNAISVRSDAIAVRNEAGFILSRNAEYSAFVVREALRSLGHNSVLDNTIRIVTAPSA